MLENARSDDDLQLLLEASAMANLACGSSGLGLVHALSSATRLRVPHGRANGVLLPWVADLQPRGAAAASALAEAERILPLYAAASASTPSFRPGDLDEDAIGRASSEVALASPLHLNNSRHATAEELEGILASASSSTRRLC